MSVIRFSKPSGKRRLLETRADIFDDELKSLQNLWDENLNPIQVNSQEVTRVEDDACEHLSIHVL